MNLKLLLPFATGIVALGALSLAQLESFNSTEVQYTPRSKYNAVQYAEGAFEYYKSIRANVFTGEIEAEDVLQMRKAVERFSRRSGAKNADVNWSSMGPDNVGGRTRAILPFPGNPSTLITGGVSGGLFKTTNAGQSWVRLPNFSENLVVSTLAMLGNGAIYCGTGNSRENTPTGDGGSQFLGGGLFVSINQGETWSLVSNFKPVPLDNNSNWAFTNKIKADPSNPDRLWIGSNFGLYPYIHGTETLGALPPGLLSNAVGDLEVSADGQNLIVTIGPRVYVSTNFGQTFAQANSGPFSASLNGAMDLDIARYNKNEMYVSVPTTSGFLKNIFYSGDAGATWRVIAPSSQGGTSQFSPFYNGLTAQGNYDNMITVVPQIVNGNREVIMGGIRLYKYAVPENSTPGISLWENINANFATSPGGPPSPFHVHSDIHTAEWDDLNRLWIGCDGGIFRSDNFGLTWIDLNKDYTTTQYYAIAFSPSGQVLGGLQDNGSLFLDLEGISPRRARQVTGGDGFSCELSQEFPDFMFTTIYNGAVFRSSDNGASAGTLGDLEEVSSGGGTDFFTDIALHENPNNSFSEQFVRFIPLLDNPNIQYIPNDGFEVTAAGDTIIGKIPANTQITVEASGSEFLISKVLTEDLNIYSYYQRVVNGVTTLILNNVTDTTFVQETPQFMLAAALSNGVYLTRNPLSTNALTTWFKIGVGESTQPSSLEFSPDGDHLYVGYSNGRVIRYSGLNGAWIDAELTAGNAAYALTKTTIHTGSGALTDIEVDYSQGQGTAPGAQPASQRVVITHGGYGGSNKVRLSNSAASVSGSGSFVNIWTSEPGIQGMPCYSVVMDINNPQVFMVGTEYGTWYSGDQGATWTETNNGDMNRVPVFDLRQQKYPEWKVGNSGVVYAGSHGRGIFKTDYLFSQPTSVTDNDGYKAHLAGLKIFPNPLSGNEGTIQFDLADASQLDIYIYSIDGRLVDAVQNQRLESGLAKQIRFDAGKLSAGTYIVQVQSGSQMTSGKFIRTK